MMLGRWPAAAICSALLAVFAVLSYSAVLSKSATIDEPVESLGSWTQLHLHDFRMNFEHPPLWHYLAALPNGRNAIRFNSQDEAWVQMPSQAINQLAFAKRTLFQTPGNNGMAFINRSRFVMLLLSVMLGALVALWSWRWAGPMAAIIATTLFAFDPNLIGHGSLVKNDMSLALAMTAVFFTVWRVGMRATVLNLSALALLVAAAINIKFSGVLLAPMIFIILLIRAFSAEPWIICGMTLKSRPTRFAAASILLIGTLGTSILGIWACYGFRFNPSPDPTVALNYLGIRSGLKINQYQSRHPPPIVPAFQPGVPLAQRIEALDKNIEAFHRQLEAYRAIVEQTHAIGHAEILKAKAKIGADVRIGETNLRNILASLRARDIRTPQINEQEFVTELKIDEISSALRREIWLMEVHAYVARIPLDASLGWLPDSINFMIDHRLLPSAWLNGLLKVYMESIYRGSFLMGQLSGTGWWYYFPVAAIFKTPVAICIVSLLSAALGIAKVMERFRSGRRWPSWSLACVLVPFAVYLAMAITTKSDIGWRYLIPLYPFFQITAGVLLARTLNRWPGPALTALLSLGLVLLIETLYAWPNYIAFFNIFAGGSRGGFALLSDSNLDWGQDLPLLARWQREHPDVPLALSYFGDSTVDPAYYGINADPLSPGYPNPQVANSHILAISATRIQNPYGERYDAYQQFTPFDVLGGTIYLYDLRSKQ